MTTFDPSVFAFDPRLWTIEKPNPSKWYWFDGIGIGPHVDCRSKMSDGFVRSILPIPSAQEIAALVECEKALCYLRSAVEGVRGFKKLNFGSGHMASMRIALTETMNIDNALVSSKDALARLDAARKERGT